MTENKSYSNVTEAELREKLEEQKRQKKCPTCGSRIDREMRMHRFHADIVDFLRENRVVKYDSCILCVKKHIGYAMALYDEMLKSKGSGTADGIAKVNVILDELKLIGNLQAAIDESEDFTELNEQIKTDERAYRYEGIEPNWSKIAELIVKYIVKNANGLRTDTEETERAETESMARKDRERGQ